MIALPATPADGNELTAMLRDLSLWLKARGIAQWSDAFPLEAVEREIAKGEVFLVREQGKIIASVVLSREGGELWSEPDEGALYLNRLAVVRKRKGERIGEALLAWAEGEARRQGASALRLVCDERNSFLTSYYSKQGYALLGTKLHVPWNMTFARFEKRL